MPVKMSEEWHIRYLQPKRAVSTLTNLDCQSEYSNCTAPFMYFGYQFTAKHAFYAHCTSNDVAWVNSSALLVHLIMKRLHPKNESCV